MSKPKKKFKETKLGKLVGNIAPNILGVAGDLLPDAGVLGIVKNLVSKDKNISPKDKELIHNQIKELLKFGIHSVEEKPSDIQQLATIQKNMLLK